MKKLVIAAFAAMFISPAAAHTYHYVCTGGDERYALTVDTDKRTVKVITRSPTRPFASFRILKVSDVCAKYGWDLSDGARFCTFTQGVGNLNASGFELDCDSADTE